MRISCRYEDDDKNYAVMCRPLLCCPNSIFEKFIINYYNYTNHFDFIEKKFKLIFKPSDVVILGNLNILGPDLYWVATELKYFIENNISIFIEDSYGFSTVDDNYKPVSNEKLETIISILNTILNDVSLQKLNRGKTKALIDDSFIDAYWKWQRGDYSTGIAIEETRISRSTFYSLSYEYERTLKYKKYLEQNALELIATPKLGKISSCIGQIMSDDIDLVEITAIERERLRDYLMRVNHIDFWRQLISFHKSKEYNEKKAKSRHFAPSLEFIVEDLYANPEKYVISENFFEPIAPEESEQARG